MDSEDNVSLTSFRPLSPDTSKSSFSLARLFQRKRPEARVEVKIDSKKKHRPVSPLVSPRSSPQLQKRVSTSKSPEIHRSWSSSHVVGRKISGHASPVVGSRRASPGYRANVHAVLGRLNAAADGRGQVSIEKTERVSLTAEHPPCHRHTCTGIPKLFVSIDYGLSFAESWNDVAVAIYSIG